ncbi:MAG TPA: hypothetical protein VIU44_08115 [Gaiellaceae bacterium]
MRKEKFYEVADENRDKGKVFFITEMSAYHAEAWAHRAFLAMMRNGSLALPAEITMAGMAGMAIVGLPMLLNGLAGVRYEEVRPLLDELMGCVKIVPDPARRDVRREIMVDTDVEEVSTLSKLKWEVFNLHVDFSSAGALLKSLSASAEMKSRDSSTTQTSPAQ